jgi:hypothetical protein
MLGKLPPGLVSEASGWGFDVSERVSKDTKASQPQRPKDKGKDNKKSQEKNPQNVPDLKAKQGQKVYKPV